ncbi:TPA: hypothetical protein ACH3X1_008363 [Trebouxia sp. C0004]
MKALRSGAACPHIKAGPSKHHSITPSTYFGPGVVKTIQETCTAYEPAKLFVNAALSPVQQRNLELAVGVPVLDRVGLIIDIFAQRARTREARLQVELAALEYRSSRLVRVLDAATGQRMGFGEGGASEVVSARERGRSGSSSGGLGGAGGGGQSELQLQRQRLIARRKALQKKLSEVQRTREVQRAGRRRSGKPVLAVVGYTNAGKSSLLQALTHTNTGVEDRLFATLDPTLRRVHLPSGREAILSDTVGFISDLPHQLVNAFKATLEEVCEADLLLHVLDASSPNVQHQRASVLQVLRDLGISEARLQNGLVEVWNKTDLLPSAPPADSHVQLQPTCEASRESASIDLQSNDAPSCGCDETNSIASAVHAQPLQHQQPALQSQNGSGSILTLGNQQQPPSVSSSDASGIPSDAHQQPNSTSQQQAEEACSDHQHASELQQTHPSSIHRQQQQHQQQWQSQQSVDAQLSRQPHFSSHSQQQQQPGGHRRLDIGARTGQISAEPSNQGGRPVAVFASAVTGAGLQELLLELERKISVKCAARELADETARLGSRLLTTTIVGPASKHRRPRWRGLGEWESTLTQSLRGQSTSSASERSWDAMLGVNIKDADRWASLFVSAAKKS